MRLLFRADASPSTGTGHVMRCLALAQAAHDAGHRTAFLLATGAGTFKERLRQEGCDVHELASERGSLEDALETAAFARTIGAMCTVIDGYVFDETYQSTLREKDTRFLIIDDYGHASAYSADMILNQNPYAKKLEHIYRKRAKQSALLLGSTFVLLRREYVAASPRSDVPTTARKILLTMGGGDVSGMTRRMVMILKNMKGSDLDVTIVIGGANPHADEIVSVAQGMHIIRDAQNMPDLLAQAELAIAAGGTTAYELAYMGVPALLFILAKNQRAVAEDLHRRGIVHLLGEPSALADSDIALSVNDLVRNEALRRDMSKKGRMLVDGKGAERVLQHLLTLAQ